MYAFTSKNFQGSFAHIILLDSFKNVGIIVELGSYVQKSYYLLALLCSKKMLRFCFANVVVNIISGSFVVYSLYSILSKTL